MTLSALFSLSQLSVYFLVLITFLSDWLTFETLLFVSARSHKAATVNVLCMCTLLWEHLSSCSLSINKTSLFTALECHVLALCLEFLHHTAVNLLGFKRDSCFSDHCTHVAYISSSLPIIILFMRWRQKHYR